MKQTLRIFVGGDQPDRPWTLESLTEHLAAELERAGAAAPAPPALQLPPASALALQLGVTASLVRSAYSRLAARALIERSGRGFALTAPPIAPPAASPQLPALPAFRPVLPANRPARGTPGFITLSSAFLDPRLIPTRAIARCMRAALRQPGLSTYADAQGYRPLRQLIARRLERLGITADPEHILLTVGSQQVLDLVCRSLAVKRIATEDPAYIAAKALFELSDVELTGLPVDPFTGVDLARWRRLLASRRPSLAYLTSNFQNPTGYSYSSRELHQILAWSQEFQMGLLEDDWGEGMLPGAEHRPTLRALGGDRVLYMNAFTKKTLPSLRVGYVVANEQTLPSLLQSKKLSINGSPAMVEETLFEFLDSGGYDAYLAATRQELTARYHHCLAALRSLMPKAVRWTMPGGGPVLWLDIPRHVSLVALVGELEQRKILVNPQSAAFLGAPHLHGLMIGYAFPDRREMTTALEILGELLTAQLAPARLARTGS